MAKQQQIPMMPKAGGGKFKALAGLALIAFVVLVVKAPTEAAQLIGSGSAALGSAADSLMTFLAGIQG